MEDLMTNDQEVMESVTEPVNEVTQENQEKIVEEVKEEAHAPEKPKFRRGVATARGTTRMKFSHKDATPNGLFLAHLESVEVTEIPYSAERASFPYFAGLGVPRLTFTFASNEADQAKRKYVTLSFNAVESTIDTIPNGKEAWKVDSTLDWLNHLVKVYYLKGRELTDNEANALTLQFNDFDDDGNFVPLDPELVRNAWGALFLNIRACFNTANNGKPIYLNQKGDFIPVFIKLVRYTKVKNTWVPIVKGKNNEGDLAFKQFVGEGGVEMFSPSSIPALSLNPLTERILPILTETVNRQPNMPTVGATINPMPPTAPMAQGFAETPYTDANLNTEEDLPF